MTTPLNAACERVLREALRGNPAPPWQLWLEALTEATHADSCSILELRGADLVPLAVHGLSPDALGRRFPVVEHPRLQAIMRSADVLRFPAASPLPDPFDGLIPNAADHLHVHDCAGVPIKGTNGPLGVLTIDALRRGTFNQKSLDALRTCANLAGACLEIIERLSRMQDAMERQNLVSSALLQELRPDQQFIGRSAPIRALLKEIDTVANSDLTVLITGETGTGKELVARAIHYGSTRNDRPLISVNCAALPESLVESELFGHVAGAFSGATSNRRGKFEIADGGTLFLDEIGELPMTVQPKLLRVLQSGEIQRVGSDANIKVNVRIVAATNRDLAEEVRAGRFRADLYHRISIYPVQVPPLRQRGRDILLLAGNALERNRASLHLRGLRLAPASQQALLSASWPGNVRELEHTISRAALKAAADGAGSDRIVTIEPPHLDLAKPRLEQTAPAPEQEQPIDTEGLTLAQASAKFQRGLIERALAAQQGNWAAAARDLGLDRGNLRRLAKRLGVAQ
ncbi:anaerobic nitric oxide reductase transcriptional regulator [Steroidobacter agaridevorans]|uniref:Anaerobic nitric oxide reductase transcriptional regulator n=1 Tax=Steroidobacter agaridevorans TaxID=2695856 RepID=A0A829YA88_9GAMM|nr:nitric oxide reductase transcriptional regulator NorR [Steroidobacter agaridevorans]GFE79955.1 anaerobic nitric oxide reductase transcriptional regulator [Steroidobacter agaridevorans]